MIKRRQALTCYDILCSGSKCTDVPDCVCQIVVYVVLFNREHSNASHTHVDGGADLADDGYRIVKLNNGT